MKAKDIPEAYTQVMKSEYFDEDAEVPEGHEFYTVNCLAAKSCDRCLGQHGIFKRCPSCNGKLPDGLSEGAGFLCKCGASLCTCWNGEVQYVTGFSRPSAVTALIDVEEDTI